MGGVPLAYQLFDEDPQVDTITRQQLVYRVRNRWSKWSAKNGKSPEEYLSYLQQQFSRDWMDAVWYVSLVIALKMGYPRLVGNRPMIVRHYIGCTSGVPEHEQFWSTIFRHSQDVTVITTNYDILAERGIRLVPRPKVFRPGFNYGNGPELLAGRGYPSFSHINPLILRGSVPILKLHGSVSWTLEKSGVTRFHDCRPAIKGNAAIVAPVMNKKLPSFLQATWDHAAKALANSHTWLIVGYSLPQYDLNVRSLLQTNSSHRPNVHVFDPNPDVLSKYAEIINASSLHGHDGLPNSTGEIAGILHAGAGV